MSAVTLGGIMPFNAPPLYTTSRGTLGKLLLDDKEIDQLRIEAVRRCEAVCRDLAGLQARPATIAQLLAGPDGIRKLLVSQVDFAAADAVRKAAAKLESLLGEDGTVADPRPEFIAGTLTMRDIRELVAHMDEMIAPYEKMREQLK